MVIVVEMAHSLSLVRFSFPSLNNRRQNGIFSGKKMLPSVSGEPLPQHHGKVDLDLDDGSFQLPMSEVGQVLETF